MIDASVLWLYSQQWSWKLPCKTASISNSESMKCKGRKSRYDLVDCCFGKDSNASKNYNNCIVLLLGVMPTRSANIVYRFIHQNVINKTVSNTSIQTTPERWIFWHALPYRRPMVTNGSVERIVSVCLILKTEAVRSCETSVTTSWQRAISQKAWPFINTVDITGNHKITNNYGLGIRVDMWRVHLTAFWNAVK
jgi:hypothetical protein